jgi:hypothetical protein
MSSNTLIISPEIFKARTPAHTNTDNKLIYPIIKVVQDVHILPLLGSALLAKLQTEIAAKTLDGDYLILREEYLYDVMIWLIMQELPDVLQYQYFNAGVETINAEKQQAVDRLKLNELKTKYKSYAEYYIKRCNLYLRENAATKFPEYLEVITALDEVTPTNRAYTCPIYLEDTSTVLKESYSNRNY